MGRPITTAEQAVAVLLGLRSRHRARGDVAAAATLDRAIVAVRAQMRAPKVSQPAAIHAAPTRKDHP
jgi:hypothetical protein